MFSSRSNSGSSSNVKSDNKNKYTLINPYDLLGFDSKNPNITMKELKSSYYTLSLICHPDKGGNSEDMVILKNAYEYIKVQIEGKDSGTKDYKETEEAFNEFMKEQSKDPPPFAKVYEEAHVWLQEFNEKFNMSLKKENEFGEGISEEIKKFDNFFNDDDNTYNFKSNPYGLNEGYGDLMNNDSNNYLSFEYKSISDLVNARTEELNQDLKHNFKQEIVAYETPMSSNSFSYGGYDIKSKKVDDFTTQTSNVVLSDYKKAFTSADIISIEAEKLEKNNDDIENNLERILNERKELDNNLYDSMEPRNSNDFQIKLKFEEILNERKNTFLEKKHF
jgi:curved DNA-binding protein CbpA